MKRFYNGETKQIHRFIPLFENIEDGKVMGICMDSDRINFLQKNNGYKSIWGGNWIPKIQKGQMVLVDKPHNGRMRMSYKGENIFILHKVYDEMDEGNHTSQNYLSELWFGLYIRGWKDYEEVN